MRRLTVLSGATALLLVGLTVLGVAGPAQALAPGGGGPATLPNSTSSELTAADGGSAQVGAELAGTGGVSAFSVGNVASAVGGFSIGFTLTSDVLQAFGVPEDKDICQLQNEVDGSGSTDVGISLLTGVQCNTAPNDLTSTQKNADQTAAFAPGGVGTQSCDGSFCARIYAIAAPTAGYTTSYYCVEASPLITADVPRIVYGTYGGGQWFGGTNYSQTPPTSYAYQPCPTYAGAAGYSDFSVTDNGYGVTKWAVDTNADTAGFATVTNGTSIPNPARTWICKITGSDGNTYSGPSSTFTETDAALADPKCPTLPAGVLPTQTELDLQTPGEADTSQWSEAPTTAYEADAAAYPDCATGACDLQVITLPSSVPCTTAGTCASWFTDPDKSGDYGCEYGPATDASEYSLALSECDVLSNFYDPQKQSEGQAYADPATGADPGTQTSADEDQAVSNAPVVGPETTSRSCFPSGWSAFNPVEWVMKPVECALQWAFVPDQTVIEDDFNTARTSWAETAPATVMSAVSSWNLAPVMTGCDGFTWQPPGTPALGTNAAYTPPPQQIADACAGQTFASAASWTYNITTILAIVGGTLALVALAAKTFNFEGPDSDN